MSEGEGGYKPPSADSTTSRRTFLKDMLKVGASVTAAAVAAEVIPGQQQKAVEAASATAQEKSIEGDKVLMFEADSTQFKPIGAKFQILRNPNVSRDDINAVQKVHFEQIGGTAVAVSDQLIKFAQEGKTLTPQQTDAIYKAFVDVQRTVFEILYPQSPTSKGTEK
jgi:hypothetical protein